MRDYQPEMMFHTDQIKHNTDHHREDLASFVTVTVQSNPASRGTGDQAGFTRRRRCRRVQGVMNPKGTCQNPCGDRKKKWNS
ncbi:hypothetical protein ROHU_029777 [Labeo rohita]|uniref:Uncharacterized protein n=1 Tax=Labeo rohita TaxID=84645 RepID=A0A498LTY1_LABRO|nr:hypothetical protein ROHU_029777 [Labeo rohita]